MGSGQDKDKEKAVQCTYKCDRVRWEGECDGQIVQCAHQGKSKTVKYAPVHSLYRSMPYLAVSIQRLCRSLK